jgi:hypothetical protein
MHRLLKQHLTRLTQLTNERNRIHISFICLNYMLLAKNLCHSDHTTLIERIFILTRLFESLQFGFGEQQD